MCLPHSYHALVEPFTILSGSSSLPDVQAHNLLISSGTNISVELLKTRGDVSWLLLLVTPDGTFANTGVAARAAPHMSPDWP